MKGNYSLDSQDADKFIANATKTDPTAPFTIIISCAKALGWDIAIEEGQENVRGMTIGTSEYIDTYFKEDN